jgi:protein phosphatase 1 regulatory subunit 7
MLVRIYIKKIEGLQEIDSLETLWLNENKLKVISGLDGCPNLYKVVLSENYIHKIEGLDNNKEIKELWINDNLLTVKRSF